jgi:hypothetical protein
LSRSSLHDQFQRFAILTESAYLKKNDVLVRFVTSAGDLTKAEPEEHLIEHGPNVVAMERQRG